MMLKLFVVKGWICSDARFVKNHCPVVEFGLVGKTMHAVDERVEVAQIVQLKAIYTRILQDYFAQ